MLLILISLQKLFATISTQTFASFSASRITNFASAAIRPTSVRTLSIDISSKRGSIQGHFLPGHRSKRGSIQGHFLPGHRRTTFCVGRTTFMFVRLSGGQHAYTLTDNISRGRTTSRAVGQQFAWTGQHLAGQHLAGQHLAGQHPSGSHLVSY